MFGMKAKAAKEAFLSFHATACEEHKYTPDLSLFSRKQHVKVFLYDGLMKGYPDNHLIAKGGKRLGVGFTGSNFTMWKPNNSNSEAPIALDKTFLSTPGAPVKGEVWKLTPQQIISLDKEKENGHSFKRVRVPINVLHRGVMYNHQPNSTYRETRAGDSREFYDRDIKYLGPQRNMPIECWMYVGKTEVWEPKLDGGFFFKSVRKFHGKHFDYFYYSLMEYDD